MGRRTIPHTAGIRIEAWAPSREECLTEAVTALVDVLDEVIYRVETTGQVPVGVAVRPVAAGCRSGSRWPTPGP